jgi:hypothetical protein
MPTGEKGTPEQIAAIVRWGGERREGGSRLPEREYQRGEDVPLEPAVRCAGAQRCARTEGAAGGECAVTSDVGRSNAEHPRV